MAPLRSTAPERHPQEQRVLKRLLELYGEQREVYGRMLELSRRQTELVEERQPVGEIRRVLEQKRDCLDVIRRLEISERQAKVAWRDGRARWSSESRARLHGALREICSLIEEILQIEEANDRVLLKMAGAE